MSRLAAIFFRVAAFVGYASSNRAQLVIMLEYTFGTRRAHFQCMLSRDTEPLRLGFPVKVMSRPDLKSCDTRRSQSNPHLKKSLEYVENILKYLGKIGINMYRLSSDLAPYATHPDMPQFHNMVSESDAELAHIGRLARDLDMRLSFHPSQYILLNSPDPDLTRKSTWDLSLQAEMLDRMELGPEAVVVTHVGGVYGDHEKSRERWIDGWNHCPDHVKKRLVLENDDTRFSAADVLWIHEHTGVRLIFDYQHFWCLNPEQLEMRSTMEKFLKTWPDNVRPKIHFSSPRTEMRELKKPVTAAQRKAIKSGSTSNTKSSNSQVTRAPVKSTSRQKTVLLPPVWTGHADFTNPFEFATFMRTMDDLIFDCMMESKSKDLSVMKLRVDLLRYAPDVAARFGIYPSAADQLEVDERILQAGTESADDSESPDN